MDLESVKISGSDSGILREGWEKKFDPSIYPLGSHGTPNFFSLGGLPSLYFTVKFHAPATKTGVLGWGKFLIFLNSNLQHEVWQRACTRANYYFDFILQGTKFAKKNSRTGFLNFFPVLEIWPPKLYQFFGKFLPKIHVGLVWGI